MMFIDRSILKFIIFKDLIIIIKFNNVIIGFLGKNKFWVIIVKICVI